MRLKMLIGLELGSVNLKANVRSLFPNKTFAKRLATIIPDFAFHF